MVTVIVALHGAEDFNYLAIVIEEVADELY